MKLTKDTLIEGVVYEKGTGYEIGSLKEGADIATDLKKRMEKAKSAFVRSKSENDTIIGNIHKVGMVQLDRASIQFTGSGSGYISLHKDHITKIKDEGDTIIIDTKVLTYYIFL